jgi:hypothetical protein
MTCLKYFAVVLLSAGLMPAQSAAPTPPMGWNSWDSYGITINEKEFLDNAAWMAAHLRRFGWQYAVIDEGWYVVDPLAKPETAKFRLDDQGRYIPVDSRFPSAANGAGFGPVAKKLHAEGLKFGIHLIRGIPKEAVARKMQFSDNSATSKTYSAADAADTSDTCPWNTYNYGVKDNAAGQAYYDSLARLYASWGVDYIKIDCISDHPYKSAEIRMISTAIHKSGRPMVLSLSPGPTSITKGPKVSKWAEMWRISDDFWDVWKVAPGKQFPQDLVGQFQKAAAWAQYAGNGHWPDADMLPLGHLGPRPGNENDRDTKLTHDEQRTLMTLWCTVRSPLIMGGNLLKMDNWTTSLLTNPEVLALDQHSKNARQVLADGKTVVWREGPHAAYISVFNLTDQALKAELTWQQLDLPSGPHPVRDLWSQQNSPPASGLTIQNNPHGATLIRISY